MRTWKTKPYAHQKSAYDFMKGKNQGALFMEQGTGKSKAIIDIVSNLYIEGKINAVLLIAPNLVHRQWEEEQLPLHSPVEYLAMSWSSIRTRKYARDLGNFFREKRYLKWFCVNIEAFSILTHLPKFTGFTADHKTAIILDEATTIKNPKANRSYNIRYKLADYREKGRKLIYSNPYSLYRYILTGTMVTNSPYDLWAMMDFLQPNFFNMSYYAFRCRYGLEKTAMNYGSRKEYRTSITAEEIRRIEKLLEKNSLAYVSACTGMTETDLKYIKENPGLTKPYKNLDELKELIAPVSYIVRKKDCLDLPKKIYEKTPVELSAEQKRIYKDLERDYFSNLDESTLTVQNKISLVLRLSQITGGFFPVTEGENVTKPIKGNAKLEVLKRDLYETDEKLIIFCRFTAEIDLITIELKKEFPERTIKKYYGKTTVEDRNQIKKDFAAGKIDILVANPTCAGVGLNLQRASLVYYYSNDYSLYYREQSEDRCHRIGTVNNVVYKDLVARGTVDEKVYKALREKKELLEYFREKNITDFLQED